jgi:uncharacterized membrane protein
MSDENSLKTVATIVYALQAVGFFVGLTWIVAAVIDYVKRDDAKGTWLESHFSWQIRTFWWGLLWAVVGGLAQPRRGQAGARRNLISSG